MGRVSSKVVSLKLKKLLMRRASAAIPLRSEGSSIERLYKKGLLTDEIKDSVKDLKTFIDKDFEEVQGEADELSEGWANR